MAATAPTQQQRRHSKRAVTSGNDHDETAQDLRSLWANQPTRSLEVECQGPLGPESLDGLMDWPAQFLMRCDDVGLRGIIEHNLAQGVRLYSDYSGMGCFEQAAAQLHATMEDLGYNTGKGFEGIRASDNKRLQTTVLMGHAKPEGPTHVFGDLLQRIDKNTFEVLTKIKVYYTKVYHERLAAGDPNTTLQKTLGMQMIQAMQERLQECNLKTQAWCFTHNDFCSLEGEDGPGKGSLRMACAGTTCTDFTSKNQNHPGLFGDNLIVLLVWLQLMLVAGYDVILHECTPLFPTWLIRHWLEVD